jgi:hypothetical protein
VQYTLNQQPIYDVANGLINFGYTGNAGGVVAPQTTCYFNLPTSALPYNDSSFCYVARIGNYSSAASYASIVGGGTTGTGGVCFVQLNTVAIGQVGINCYAGGFSNAGTMSANAVYTFKYISGNPANGTNVYINGTLTASGIINSAGITTGTTSINRVQTNGNNAIGYSVVPGFAMAGLNSQMYNLYIFSSSLNGPGAGTDQALIEATPYPYTAPDTLTLTFASVTATSFILTSSVPTGVAYYNVDVGGIPMSSTFYTSLSGVTITPGVAGPWVVNVYAYNSSYGLIARGNKTTNIIISTTNLRYYFTFDALVGGYLPNLSPNATVNDKFTLNSPTVLSTSIYKFGTSSGASGGYIRCITAYTLPTTGLSYSVWVYISSTMTFSTSPLFGFSSSAASPVLYLALTGSTGNTNCGWYVSGTSGSVTTGMTSNTWYHICWTISPAAYGASCTYTFYLNGIVFSTVSGSYPGSVSVGYQDIFAYAGLSGPSGFYIDNLRYYECTLTAANVSDIYSYLDPNGII